MPVLLCRHQCRRLLVLVLLVGLMLSNVAMAAHLKDDVGAEEGSFSVLILGDSQMAGAGWEGGYANCLQEAYPNAQVFNLAQNGSLLANGDIRDQWEFYLSDGGALPDFVLLDGGINDLSYIRRAEFEETGLALVHEALRTLIEQIHEESPDTHIIYTIMPPLEEWKDSENGPPSYEIQDLYWKYLNIIVSAYDYVTVIDLFSLNPFHFPCAECYHQYLADSIHLNEAGYRKTFEHVENILLVRLAQKLGE